MTKKILKRRWDTLKKRLPQKDKIIGLELGIWEGKMSEKLLQQNPNLFLVMVDWWEKPEEGHSYYKGSKIIVNSPQEVFDDAYKLTLKRVNPFKGRYKIYKQESEEASKLFENEYFDFIFFDGDHSPEGLTRDLNNWVPKIKKGGLISGHDWKNDPKNFQDVKPTVESFFKDKIKDIEIDVDATWFLYKDF